MITIMVIVMKEKQVIQKGNRIMHKMHELFTFEYALLTLGPTLRIPKKYKNPNKPNTCALVAFQLLKDCHKDYTVSRAISSRSIQMLSQTLDTELASHFKGRIPLLLEKV